MSTALELAEALEFHGRYGSENEDQASKRRVKRNAEAAAELRRLSAIEAELKAIKEAEPVAYLYHDAPSAEQASSILSSTLIVLAADRRPTFRNETPLYTLEGKS